MIVSFDDSAVVQMALQMGVREAMCVLMPRITFVRVAKRRARKREQETCR
jgi:hypothetical protein